MTQQTVEEPSRRFLVPVKRAWKLWIPPTIALLYFSFVIVVVVLGLDLRVPDQEFLLVMGGVGLFAFLILWELILLPTVKARRKKETPKAARAEAAPAAPEAVPVESEPLPGEAVEDEIYAPPEAPAESPSGDVEIVLTNAQHQGRRVIELSAPPKSANPGAIYSKAFVPVDDHHVLRAEDLVADASDF